MRGWSLYVLREQGPQDFARTLFEISRQSGLRAYLAEDSILIVGDGKRNRSFWAARRRRDGTHIGGAAHLFLCIALQPIEIQADGDDRHQQQRERDLDVSSNQRDGSPAGR